MFLKMTQPYALHEPIEGFHSITKDSTPIGHAIGRAIAPSLRSPGGQDTVVRVVL